MSTSGDNDSYSAFIEFISRLSEEIDGLDDRYLSVHIYVDDRKAGLEELGPTTNETASVLDGIATQLEVVGDAIAHCRRILIDAVTDPGSGTDAE